MKLGPGVGQQQSGGLNPGHDTCVYWWAEVLKERLI